jgi:thiamine-phosphate pyrophosphorylase
MPPFRFYLISDRRNARHDARVWLPRLVDAGLRALQVREKDLSPAECFAYARELRDALGETHPDFAFFLNDRADLALSLAFAGVHLREDSLPLEAHAPTLRQRLRFGVSTHTLEGVTRAEAAGADFATFGPVYDTASKAAYGAPVGLKALERAAAHTKLPLIALGGVTPQRVAECLAAGAAGVSAISAIWNADDPVAALREFQEALGGL